jgi:hypothetical protein
MGALSFVVSKTIRYFFATTKISIVSICQITAHNSQMIEQTERALSP